MPFYHFRFIEDGGRVIVGEDHDCVDDKGALLRAYAELEQRPFRRVEVWLRDRRIASLGAVEASPTAANSSAGAAGEQITLPEATRVSLRSL
jgi:hypothetical protein